MLCVEVASVLQLRLRLASSTGSAKIVRISLRMPPLVPAVTSSGGDIWYIPHRHYRFPSYTVNPVFTLDCRPKAYLRPSKHHFGGHADAITARDIKRVLSSLTAERHWSASSRNQHQSKTRRYARICRSPTYMRRSPGSRIAPQWHRSRLRKRRQFPTSNKFFVVMVF